ncbi:MAG: Eco57I restriction-modification methylase domain-containing protein [Fulvivirga sp.]
MDKNQLHKIFSKPFDHSGWIELLKSVFGAKHLLAQPKPIILPNTDKAKAAFELGSFTTSDDRVIGLYKVEVNPDVWLERNKVGLRELLRNVYKYDVDGALIVFEQHKKWRLSFVSEIKVLNEEGEVVKQATEPKRYTYLLGEGEKVLTPSIRLSKLTGKTLTLEDIRDVFSVEVLNEEFYKIIADQFYQLIGGTTGKSKNAKTYDGFLKLPSAPKENRQIYQEFAVRLIGRTVFCWFLKVKKSDNGEPLLPENLLSSEALKANANYYHTILEPLFFQTLNTPMEKRLKRLPKGCENIPFLNGGLFEYGADDFYKPNKQTGLSDNLNTLVIPDEWFLSFFSELEKYNFTIDENSVVDVEVSVDPEMLGRIFENLLAEIDPESGETARKATGSFYTPREIVDYMATESLVQYIHNKTGLEQDQLRPIFKMTEEEALNFKPEEKETILDALDKVKILDPACGSGAFPMGVLQKIVMALQKLDPESEWWIKRQIDRIENALLKKQIKEKLSGASVEYARKIGIIQNSLFGVDIQPIAAEISKLRCFLTLIVDENIDESKDNRGIEPLPNLEFKFVTADTLLKLPEERDFGGIFNSNDDLEALKKLRTEYLQSYGEQKETIKTEFKKVQDRIYKQQISLGKNVDVNSRAYLIGTWNPFGHDKVDWFDPEWMFGVQKFDVVIGNPPYVRIQNLNKDLKQKYAELYKSATKNYDIYVLFDERGIQLLSEGGNLVYIQPNKFFNADYGIGLRTILAENQWIYKITDFQASQMFSSATTYTCILHCVRHENQQFQYVSFTGTNKTQAFMQYASSHALMGVEVSNYNYSKHTNESWSFGTPSQLRIFAKMEEIGMPLSEFTSKIFQGLVTSADPVFIVEKTKNGFYSKYLDKEIQLEKNILKPLLKGAEIRRYKVDFQNLYLIFPYQVINDRSQLIPPASFKKKHTQTWDYLKKCEDKLRGRESGKMDHDNWYAYVYPKNLDQFEQPKIMTQVLASKASMVFDKEDGYHFVGGGNAGGYGIVLKDNSELDYWYLLGLLNSRLLDFYLQNHTSRFQNNYFSYAKRFIDKLPIKVSSKQVQSAFRKITFNIQFMLKDLGSDQINEYVPNSHLIQQFEEVIDAMVYELYFEADFKKAGIEFIKYAERDFETIEGLNSEQAKQVIHKVYQKLRQKENEIRNNLKLMDIRLRDLIMPIKTAH